MTLVITFLIGFVWGYFAAALCAAAKSEIPLSNTYTTILSTGKYVEFGVGINGTTPEYITTSTLTPDEHVQLLSIVKRIYERAN